VLATNVAFRNYSQAPKIWRCCKDKVKTHRLGEMKKIWKITGKCQKTLAFPSRKTTDFITVVTKK